MTVVTVEQGYLQSQYDTGEYLAIQVHGAIGSQFQAVIDFNVAFAAQFQGVIDSTKALATQFQGVVSSTSASGSQYESHILDRLSAIGAQFNGFISTQTASGVQFSSFIGNLTGLAVQLQGVISSLNSSGIQYQSTIVDRLNVLGIELDGIISTSTAIGTQFQGIISGLSACGVQLNAEPFVKTPVGTQFEAHIVDRPQGMASQFIMAPYVHIWANYLVEDYLVGTYLTKNFHIHVALQFEAKNIDALHSTGFQFQGVIQGYAAKGVQFQGFIQGYKPLGVQFTSVNPAPLGVQFRAALYNTDHLRVLCEFPSRGTGGGTNWTANSTASGDFGISNVNTDIVEQVWRSQVITGVQLTCDTGLPQGVFLDTLAILNHNLTTSASVLLEGDDDPLFGSPGFSQSLSITANDSYWVSPSLPLEGFRYWRFTIDDSTNTDAYLQIGTIIFGEATIFVGENFSNPLRLKKTHFSDKVYTEGFTNVSNDRAFKKSIALTFNNLVISGGNYTNLAEIIGTARTNLKCLWIPTPKYPERYAVFGKLTQLPEEEHNDLGQDADYVNMSIEVDESL
jgi:hypothetical protein